MSFKVWTCVSLQATATIIPSSATLSFSLLIFRLLQTVRLISIFLRHIYSSIIFSMSLGSVCCHQVPFVNKNNTFKCKYKRRLDVKCGIAEPSREPAPMGYKTRYDDNFFDKAFMTLFARKMNNVNGQSGGANQYEEFVQASRRVMHGRSPKQQQEAVRKVLLSMLPPGAPQTFRKLFPPTRWSAAFNAALTVPFFQWLVGPSEVVEVEVNGVKQKSGVHIKKCRYLENSGCVGMCVNMCKIPTQDFFTNEFGLPLTMTPNFDDMSCDMVYGQPPPTPDDDPAFKQPCYAIFCSTAQPDQDVCPKLLS